jgi:microcystin-dependent protein
MSSPYLGEIRLMSFNFAPKNWAFCNGQTLSIAQNQALFSLLGTTYGGDGVINFALPNLQSRIPIHFGTGPGLSPYSLGQVGGTTAITLISSQMPSHSHIVNVTSATASTDTINNTVLPAAPTAANASLYAIPGSPALEPQAMAFGAIGVGGGSQPHNNLMPSLAVTFAICLLGIFPTRS